MLTAFGDKIDQNLRIISDEWDVFYSKEQSIEWNRARFVGWGESNRGDTRDQSRAPTPTELANHMILTRYNYEMSLWRFLISLDVKINWRRKIVLFVHENL